MYALLERACRDKTLCEVYCDPDDCTKFSVGYILGVDDEFFVMECVSPAGRHDGLRCFPVDDVFDLRRNTRYLTCIKKLMPYYSFTRKDIDITDKNVLEQIFGYAAAKQKICCVALLPDSILYGYIKDYSSDYVSLQLLDSYGQPDGESSVRIDDIKFVSLDSDEEIKLEILSK